MTNAILQRQRRNTHTPPALVNHQIQRKPLDKKLDPLPQRLPIQRMHQRMPRAIRRTRRPIRLAALSKLQTLPPERALINPTISRPRKRHPKVLQLNHRGHRFPRHVVHGVLVAEPVGPLDGVVHVPAPVVGAHVAQRRVDAALRRDRVRARREEFRHARRAQPRGCQPDGCAQACATCAEDDGAVAR
jgi:hypothetical protein